MTHTSAHTVHDPRAVRGTRAGRDPEAGRGPRSPRGGRALGGALLAAAALLTCAAPAQAAPRPTGPDNWLYLTVGPGETPSVTAQGTLLLCDPPQGHRRAADPRPELAAAGRRRLRGTGGGGRPHRGHPAQGRVLHDGPRPGDRPGPRCVAGPPGRLHGDLPQRLRDGRTDRLRLHRGRTVAGPRRPPGGRCHRACSRAWNAAATTARAWCSTWCSTGTQRARKRTAKASLHDATRCSSRAADRASLSRSARSSMAAARSGTRRANASTLPTYARVPSTGGVRTRSAASPGTSSRPQVAARSSGPAT